MVLADRRTHAKNYLLFGHQLLTSHRLVQLVCLRHYSRVQLCNFSVHGDALCCRRYNYSGASCTTDYIPFVNVWIPVHKVGKRPTSTRELYNVIICI